MRSLTVRELIYALLDFPLDSEVFICNGDESHPILNIFHDSEYGDFGECYYDYTGIVFTYGFLEDFKQDFRGAYVNKNVFKVWDDDEQDFINLRFDKEDYKFKKCDKQGRFV